MSRHHAINQVTRSSPSALAAVGAPPGGDRAARRHSTLGTSPPKASIAEICYQFRVSLGGCTPHRTGHMGNTFRLLCGAGGVDAVEREFGDGRAPSLCRSLPGASSSTSAVACAGNLPRVPGSTREAISARRSDSQELYDWRPCEVSLALSWQTRQWEPEPHLVAP
jgi:hypothetical protein